MVVVGVSGIAIGLYTMALSRRIAVQTHERYGYSDRYIPLHQALNILFGAGAVVIGVLVLMGRYP